jgi:dethiobiotin synthetase
MKRQCLVITGTDTGVGKTRLACDLVSLLRKEGLHVCGLKPICSGGREDAEALRRASGNALPLDVVNPWHFRAALAPVLAARRERKRVTGVQVVRHLRRVAQSFQVTIVEGAGGLLSPLGEGFTTRELVIGLRAVPVVVCPNRLGAVNQVLLVLAALPKGTARRAHLVLVNQRKPDASTASNRILLAKQIGTDRVHVMPWITGTKSEAGVERSLGRLFRGIARKGSKHR